MYERAVSGEVARQRPRRSELLARELLKVREMLAKTRGSELADRTFAEEKVEDEAEVGEKCGDANADPGGWRVSMTRRMTLMMMPNCTSAASVLKVMIESSEGIDAGPCRRL